MSRLALSRIGSAALLLAIAGALPPAPARADPYGGYLKFFFSPPDPPPTVIPVPRETVRAVLRREGARMIGSPRLLRFEIIAYGRDRSGAEQKFTLDAETGEILRVSLARPAPTPPPPPIDPNAPPRRPLGPPVHPGGNLDADYLGTPPPPAPPEQVLPPPPPPPPRIVEVAPAPEPDIVEPIVVAPNPDAALSPIKPQRRPPPPPAPGAPKVEKLPQ